MSTSSNLLQSICIAVFLSLPALCLPIRGLAAVSDAPQTLKMETVADDSDGTDDAARSAMSVDEIANELNNPITVLASFRNDLNYRTSQGKLPDAGSQSNWSNVIELSFPFPLSNGNNILLRVSAPIVLGERIFVSDQVYPEFLIRQRAETMSTDGEFSVQHDHIGDLKLDLAYGGVNDNGFISMFGIVSVLPISTDTSNSKGQFQLGPEVAFGKMASWGTISARLIHLTDLAGDNSFDTNLTSANLLFAYGLGNGWQVFSNPTITYDWAADSGNKLLLPIGAGISKTLRIGHMPLKLAFEIQKFVESPEQFGPDWLFTFSFTPVIAYPYLK